MGKGPTRIWNPQWSTLNKQSKRFMDELTKAYMAGILDGEGSIGIYISRSGDMYCSHMLQITVKMSTPEPVDLFSEVYGAKAHWGGIRKNSKPCKTVILRSHRAMTCLQDLLPYLRVKRKQAQIGIDFQLNKVYAPRRKGWGAGTERITEEEWVKRESYRLQMYALNSGQLGVVVKPVARAVAETEWRGAARKQAAMRQSDLRRNAQSAAEMPAPRARKKGPK
jgi:hypothetical protein